MENVELGLNLMSNMKDTGAGGGGGVGGWEVTYIL